jgi:hypothetical protein
MVLLVVRVSLHYCSWLEQDARRAASMRGMARRGAGQVSSNSWSAWTSSIVCQEAVGNSRVGRLCGAAREGNMKRMVEICAVFVCGRGLEVDWSEQDGGMGWDGREQGRVYALPWSKRSGDKGEGRLRRGKGGAVDIHDQTLAEGISVAVLIGALRRGVGWGA